MRCRHWTSTHRTLVRVGLVVVQCAWCILHSAAAASVSAQDLVGQPVVEIIVEQEGKRLSDPLVQSLIQTRVGQPLSMRDVRETFDHLYSLRRFDDIQPTAEAVSGGVRVRYVLIPSHPVDRVEFTGNLGLAETELRELVVDRFGRSPSERRKDEAARMLVDEYRRRGFPAARVTPRVDVVHDPDRAALTFDVDAGRRARIVELQFINLDADTTTAEFELPQIREGEEYDRDTVDAALRRWEDRMRSQGYYQARASGVPLVPDDAYLRVSLSRGPRVTLEFTGDPLPENELERLAPIRVEGSADEDLLEDAEIAIEQYLHARGHRDATAAYTRTEPSRAEVRITFNVVRGPRYTVDGIRVTGNSGLATPEIEKIVGISRGDLFVSSTLAARAAAVESAYRARGFTRARVKATEAIVPGEAPSTTERRVEIVMDITEGPRTTVRSLAFKGNTALPESQLRAMVPVLVGAPFIAAEVAEGSDLLNIEYRNRGYATVNVQTETALAEGDTQADVTYVVTEGPQAIVEHIIVIGNDRTKTQTILDELEIQEGQPLGLAALANSQTRLAQLGLFRRIQFETVTHAGEATRDVLILIEEADRTTLGFGGGLEGTFRPRPTGPLGTAEDTLELAPRGFFEIGRRNLWGTNRSVNLFFRVSLRATDVLVSQSPVSLERTESNLGFNEYRVVGTFREPRFFSRRSELFITGIVEQAIRTTFNFSRKIARAEVGTRLTRSLSVTGRYSFEKTKLFDEIFPDDEKPVLIDKLFPEVRISKFAGSFIRDTRDDLLDPSRGTFLIMDGDVAARAIGSEVGFVRTYVQLFRFQQLPVPRRMVVALGARVGLARGFERVKDDQIVRELPASERFFAGGDTTNRGFSLDRLGDERTISVTGFPIGGNGVLLLNGELRVQAVGPLQAVAFVDAGNVFPLASDLSFTDIRPAVGFGVRIDTLVGPVRLDWGFNLDPRVFGITEERRSVFHISLGPAF